jgi:hypothetical protein
MPSFEEVQYRLHWNKEDYKDMPFVKLDDIDGARWEIIEGEVDGQAVAWSLQETAFYRETGHDSTHWPTRVGL